MSGCKFNDFDRFAETAAADELVWLGLNTTARAEADMLIDLIRSRLTYNRFYPAQRA